MDTLLGKFLNFFSLTLLANNKEQVETTKKHFGLLKLTRNILLFVETLPKIWIASLTSGNW